MRPSKSDIIKGIEAYAHEQAVFLRLLRKRKSFTSTEFNSWFIGREWRRPRMFIGRGIASGSFLLGGASPTLFSEMLELLQLMMYVDLVDAKKTSDGVVVYSLPTEH